MVVNTVFMRNFKSCYCNSSHVKEKTFEDFCSNNYGFFVRNNLTCYGFDLSGDYILVKRMGTYLKGNRRQFDTRERFSCVDKIKAPTVLVGAFLFVLFFILNIFVRFRLAYRHGVGDVHPRTLC